VDFASIGSISSSSCFKSSLSNLKCELSIHFNSKTYIKVSIVSSLILRKKKFLEKICEFNFHFQNLKTESEK
jgi:hypothetical protein